ncbi:DNA polymerase III subunit gamma/tau [Thalassobaculum sp. OXR-137]|uniref:DNA polymerase III subunit gamma/tau n=1 Tax=Thalassobaculum sp. OXR-137 TaxID=3100173 RepID=UPI002AC9C713|nr:DNA polymerase III subunit gamma/tau [Thalassobaculum sp. OXR-137]WPZ35277.1 DNA polymerase III subunit gamma/tau [Thalassobaculum sp. OXR-137]
MNDASPPAQDAAPSEYRVLARKYRPQTFDDLKGQDALVRTLRNAFEQNRVHHAFVLTGVRGVGKTTTARIIAKGLNCIGPDGQGGPTMQPCGVCDNCRAIAEDRHVDVLEMDAASHTGVDDVRELIENVRYRPVAGRYKVYIVDEVHMLSKNAFNALLKTLEEPPEHAKFIFATTEIRKVPITVLSRCQRFDLRRIDIALLVELFERVCRDEKVEAEPEALRLVARAADGSARDGLSILDQAIALASGPVTVDGVRDMLGLVDRVRIYDLFEAVMAGRIGDGLTVLSELYDGGADPVVVIQDLMELTHAITRMKAAPQAASANDLGESERERGKALAETLAVPSLTRTWQMLSKGLGEVQAAPVPIAAAEMVLIRVAHSADMPDPADLVRLLTDGTALPAGGGAPSAPAPAASGPVASAPSGPPPRAEAPPPPVAAVPAADPVPDYVSSDYGMGEFDGGDPGAASYAGDGVPDFVTAGPPPDDDEGLAGDPDDAFDPVPTDFAGVVDLAFRRGEAILGATLTNKVHPVLVEPGRLELRPQKGVDSRMIGLLAGHLQRWTGRDWIVEISDEEGGPTLREQKAAQKAAIQAELAAHPVVAKVLELFPGAEIDTVVELAAPEPEAADLQSDMSPDPLRAGQANEA